MKLNGNIRLFNISIGLSVCQKIYNHLFLNIHNIPLKHNFPYWDWGQQEWWKNSKRVMGTGAVVFHTAVWWWWKIVDCRRKVQNSQHPVFSRQVSPWDLGPFPGPVLPHCRILGSSHSLVLSSTSSCIWGGWHTRGFGDLCLNPSFESPARWMTLVYFITFLSLKVYICKMLDNHIMCRIVTKNK